MVEILVVWSAKRRRRFKPGRFLVPGRFVFGFSSDGVLARDRYRTYTLGPTVALGRNVFANLSFVDEDLRMVTLVLLSGDRRQWTDITDLELAAAKERNDEWLATAYGIENGAASYTWGCIESVSDKKTGCAQVVVTYRNPVAEKRDPVPE